jgi:hypothetical protein
MDSAIASSRFVPLLPRRPVPDPGQRNAAKESPDWRGTAAPCQRVVKLERGDGATGHRRGSFLGRPGPGSASEVEPGAWAKDQAMMEWGRAGCKVGRRMVRSAQSFRGDPEDGAEIPPPASARLRKEHQLEARHRTKEAELSRSVIAFWRQASRNMATCSCIRPARAKRLSAREVSLCIGTVTAVPCQQADYTRKNLYRIIIVLIAAHRTSSINCS